MNKISLRQVFATAVVSIFALSLSSNSVYAADGLTKGGMKGTSEAIKVARGIVEAVGGKEVWMSMRGLYVREMVLAPSFSGQLVEEVWRDLEQPRERYLIKGEGLTSDRVWQRSGGWVDHSRRGFRELTQEEIDEAYAFWPGDIYIMYHRLAKEDQALSVSLDENGILQISENGQPRGWFQVNVNGEPIRWGLSTGTESVEYVFGPLKAFGKIHFPAWGSATDASWRYWYTDVVPSYDRLEINIEPQQTKK